MDFVKFLKTSFDRTPLVAALSDERTGTPVALEPVDTLFKLKVCKASYEY